MDPLLTPTGPEANHETHCRARASPACGLGEILRARGKRYDSDASATARPREIAVACPVLKGAAMFQRSGVSLLAFAPAGRSGGSGMTRAGAARMLVLAVSLPVALVSPPAASQPAAVAGL